MSDKQRDRDLIERGREIAREAASVGQRAAELLPCPFCEGSAGKRDIRELGYQEQKPYMIACPVCVVGIEGETPEAAIVAWNTRVARTPVVSPGWRSMESAPKDGTKVLFYTPEDSEIGWLAFVAESHYDKHGLNDTHVAQWQDGLEPTHWMPLPAPPASTEAVEGERHAYAKFSGLTAGAEWCATCWKGGLGEVRYANDLVHVIPAPVADQPKDEKKSG